MPQRSETRLTCPAPLLVRAGQVLLSFLSSKATIVSCYGTLQTPFLFCQLLLVSSARMARGQRRKESTLLPVHFLFQGVSPCLPASPGQQQWNWFAVFPALTELVLWTPTHGWSPLHRGLRFPSVGPSSNPLRFNNSTLFSLLHQP